MNDRGLVRGIALKTAHRGPMKQLTRLSLNPAIGLNGFVAGAHHASRRQVTFLDAAVWVLVQREIQSDLPWFERRANFLVEGLALERTIGRQLRVGGAIVSILGELEPCARMRDIHPLLYDALVPNCRGGVFGRIEQAGRVHVDDEVTVMAGAAVCAEAK